MFNAICVISLMEFNGIPLKFISNINSSVNDLPILFIDVHLEACSHSEITYPLTPSVTVWKRYQIVPVFIAHKSRICKCLATLTKLGVVRKKKSPELLYITLV